MYTAICSRNTSLRDWQANNYPLPSYEDTAIYTNPIDPYRFCEYLHSVGKCDIEVDQKWKAQGDLFKFSNIAIKKADIQVQFLSAEFVKSFYCYSDLLYMLTLYADVPGMIVMIEDQATILKALKTMPNHDEVVSKLFQLNNHVQEKDNFVYKSRGSLYCVCIPENGHLEFVTIAENIFSLIKTAMESKHTHSLVPIISNPSNSLIKPPMFDVFISYCWSNSRTAAKNGQVMLSNVVPCATL